VPAASRIFIGKLTSTFLPMVCFSRLEYANPHSWRQESRLGDDHSARKLLIETLHADSRIKYSMTFGAVPIRTQTCESALRARMNSADRRVSREIRLDPSPSSARHVNCDKG